MARQTNSLLVSKMVALDETPLIRFIKSDTLRESLEAKSHEKLPNSVSTIREMITSFSNQAKEYIKEKLKRLCDDSKHACLIIDEWTSCSGKRYLNINIRDIKHTFCLGLLPISGSATSENLLGMINTTLNEFGLTGDQISAITCDGASVMQKIGRISCFMLQHCYAHAIHLGNFEIKLSNVFCLLLSV